MDKELEAYLGAVEGYLKNMPVSERVDVIKELKSCMEEYQLDHALDTSEILERLGSPRELAAGYLGDKIATGRNFSFKKLLMLISFYSLVSLSGMFVIPCGTVLAGGLIASGIIGPLGGLIKLLGFLLEFDVPFTLFTIADYELHPLLSFPLSIALGFLLFWAGRAIWRAVLKYIRKVSDTKRTLDGIM